MCKICCTFAAVMSKGISLHSVVPIRAEAREGAEQLTQMLFGETCEIEELSDRWVYVKLDSDGQEGWADKKMISPMKTEEFVTYRKQLETAATVVMPMVYAVSENNGQTLPLTAGTRLTNYQNGHFELLSVGFRIDPSMVVAQPFELNQDNLLHAVRFFLNIPYLWGGKNAMGMDCSGFTQTIMSLFGKKLLRNASEQVTQGTEIAKLGESQPGDIVFFDHGLRVTGEGLRVTHVGILIDQERVIHCSGRVKVEKIDNTGILSMEQADKEHPNGIYTHHLVAIRRF